MKTKPRAIGSVMRYNEGMISRYVFYDLSTLRSGYGLNKNLDKSIRPSYNISPTALAPVVVSYGGVNVVKPMKWGLVAKGSKDTNSVFRYKTYNIPSEKVFQRHSWELAVRESRCLVAANGFYRLSVDSESASHYIYPENKELLYFAGIYGQWEDAKGITYGTFSILTSRAANGVHSSGGRTPIVIKRGDEERWLDPGVVDTNSIYDMMRPFPEGFLASHRVSPEIKSVKLNRSSLIDPV